MPCHIISHLLPRILLTTTQLLAVLRVTVVRTAVTAAKVMESAN
jgi:hypothetical protein